MGFFTRSVLLLAASLSLISPFASAASPQVARQTETEAARARRFDLTLTWEKGAPDGVERNVFKVNGQFPGPTLEFSEGDSVVIRVKNLTPFNTSIHYHGKHQGRSEEGRTDVRSDTFAGIEMLGTPWSDGVPGITQAHIPPACTFTYRWKATQHGSYFYHAHSDSQINDGLYGAITIHPAPTTPAPYELITKDSKSLAAIKAAEKARTPLLLADWRHVAFDVEWASSQRSGVETPCFDSFLVNGKGRVLCLSKERQEALKTPNQKILLQGVPGSELTDKS